MKPSTRTAKLRWIAIGTGILAIAIAAFMLIANLTIVQGGRQGIVRSTNEAPQAQAAIVLGAKVFKSGHLSHVLADRLDTGIELYRMGKVRKLLLTGDHGRTTYDEVNSMRRYALAARVPAEDIFMDHAGFNTYDSMYRARDVFCVESAVVVTQKFHLTRSVYIARTLGINAVGVPADKHIYSKAAIFDAREVLARTKAFLQLHLTRPEPRFLGEKIPVTGDGRQTNDSDT